MDKMLKILADNGITSLSDLDEDTLAHIIHSRNLTEVSSTAKYELFLKFLNKICENANLPPLQTIMNFKMVRRDHILTHENTEYLEEITEELLTVFGKKELKWDRRKHTKNYILTCLRSMARSVGAKFKPTQKTAKNKNIKNTFYSVVS